MNIKIYAVKDRALDAFMQPFYAHSDGYAIRSFTDEINKQGSTFNAHPDDYDLWRIGTYTDTTGLIEKEEGGIKQIAIGKQVKIQPQE